MKSVLIISTNANESGAPRHVEIIITNLSKNYKFSAVFGENGPVAERLRDYGFDVFILKELRSELGFLKDLKLFIKLYQIVISIRPDIIHTHSAKASFFGRLCATLAGIRSIYTVHGWGWRGKNCIERTLIYASEFIAARLFPAKYIYVAKCVETAANKYLFISKKKGSVIYNGVYLKKNKKRDNRQKGSPDKIIFSMPARVSTAKDHSTLFKAFEMLGFVNYNLLLCGAGTDKKQFIEKAREIAPVASRKIKFLGQISDIEKMYKSAHVILLISNFEALPLTIIEAMGYGKCIIATNTGGNPELIKNKIDGILVEKSNPYALYKALKKVIHPHVRKTLGLNAMKKYKELFTAEVMAQRIKHVYENKL